MSQITDKDRKILAAMWLMYLSLDEKNQGTRFGPYSMKEAYYKENE